MTGRDLIIYILENDLENEPVFKDGRLLGFLSVEEAAVKFDVGINTISLWYVLGIIPGVKIGDMVFIPCNAKKKEEKILYE